MIQVLNDKERDLKNLKQIGTPREDNKIYLDSHAYEEMQENSYGEKSVFVLMGHTERAEGRYMTFVEAVIPVHEMEFAGNTPQWNNRTWSEVFREIKQLYEDMIIVGWAINLRGMNPRVTPELERVHREHFGGVHQLLLLLDTLEKEECFYAYKNNKLVEKDGFYICQRTRKYQRTELSERRESIPVTVRNERRNVEVRVDIDDRRAQTGGRYRQLIQESEKKEKRPAENGNFGIAIAVALLVFVIGVGVYENDRRLTGGGSVEANVLEDVKENTQSETEDSVPTTVVDEGAADKTVDTETDVIPVEDVSGAQTE